MPAKAYGRYSCDISARAFDNRPLLPGGLNLGEGRGPRGSGLPGRTGATNSRPSR